MKKRYLPLIVLGGLLGAALFAVIIYGILFFFGLLPHHEPSYYWMGESGYEFSDYNLSVVDSSELECFIVKYTSENGNAEKTKFFSFSIDADSQDARLGKSNKLSCVDEKGDSIVVESANNYQYEFVGEKTFYVSYADFSEEDKKLIVEKQYTLKIGAYRFAPD